MHSIYFKKRLSKARLPLFSHNDTYSGPFHLLAFSLEPLALSPHTPSLRAKFSEFFLPYSDSTTHLLAYEHRRDAVSKQQPFARQHTVSLIDLNHTLVFEFGDGFPEGIGKIYAGFSLKLSQINAPGGSEPQVYCLDRSSAFW